MSVLLAWTAISKTPVSLWSGSRREVAASFGPVFLVHLYGGVNSGVPKKRGRPPTGRGPAVTSRLTDEIVSALDGYIGQHLEPKPSRSEMIRKILEDRLVHEGLIPPERGFETSSTSTAAQIEAQEAKIDALPSTHPEPSPEAAMKVMCRAVAEKELVELKNVRRRTTKP